MISAAEARRKTIINNKASKYMESIERLILHAVSQGKMFVIAYHDFEKRNDILSAVIQELESYGFEVDNVVYASPKPSECPDSQWDYNNGSMKISWGLNE